MKLRANVRPQWQWAKLKQLLAIVLMFWGTISMYGQSKMISGIVQSESDGEPLVGATVIVKETKAGGTTDLNGRYSVQAGQGQTLIVSYIGYRSKEIKVGKNSRIDVQLQEDNEMLDEVVVVGYGTMKRSDLTGSVVSVTGDELKKSVVTSLDQALQGRAAGVQVTQNSGTPGGGISVSIRGINSLNGNEPLYVIDGVAISGNNNGNSSVLSSINPSDIVSMEVLKDASATAIYGSRASNGVVLITTRQGETGKTKVSYEGYYALQQLPKKLKTLSLPEYAVYQNLRAATIGFGEREEFKDPTLLGEGTNWQDEIFRTAPMHNHQINISGGSQNMKYSLSGGYLQQDGIVFGSDFERFSFRVNMDNDINKWLTTGLRASVARTKQTNSVDGSGAIYNALNQLPEVPARNPDGSFGMQTENMYGTYFSNPLSDLIQNENYSRSTQVYVNAFADIKLWKGLVFRTEYAANYNYNTGYRFTPSYDYEFFKQQSSASRSAGNGSNWTLKTYLTYNGTFGKHNVSVMAGHEAQENNWESLDGSRTNFLFNSVHELNAGDATTAKANSSRGSSAIESYFGRLNYSLLNRYLFTFTMRWDGSSRFSKDNRWGTFPSLALGWKIKEENFLKDVNVLSDLKLRLGWGITGQQNIGDDFAYLPLYVVNNEYAQYPFGDTYYSTSRPKAFNENLKWEKTTTWNAGLDFGFLNGRITGGIDGYFRKTDDLLNSVKIPVGTNFNAQMTQNIGSLENYGMEFSINAKPIVTKDFTWDLSYNITWNHNEITKLTGGDDSDYYVEAGDKISRGNNTKVQAHKVGYAANSFYVYQQVYDENGKPIENMFVDRNGNGTIDSGDKYIYKKPAGDVLMGLTSKMQYKNFDFSFSLRASLNNYVYYDFLSNKANVSTSGLFSNNAYSNTSAEAVALGFSGQGDYYMSDYFIHNASFLRCDNITLGYSFQNLWKTQTYKGVGGRVYATVQNPFIISKYKGLDPEVKSGIDANPYPRAMTFLLGLSLQF